MSKTEISEQGGLFMRKIIFVLLALLLTLAGCGKEALPETSSVPSEDTHITSPSEEKTEQSTVPSSEPAKTTEVSEETAVSRRKAVLPTVP